MLFIIFVGAMAIIPLITVGIFMLIGYIETKRDEEALMDYIWESQKQKEYFNLVVNHEQPYYKKKDEEA